MTWQNELAHSTGELVEPEPKPEEVHSMAKLIVAIARFKEVYANPLNSKECVNAFAIEAMNAAFTVRLRLTLHATRLLFPIREEND